MLGLSLDAVFVSAGSFEVVKLLRRTKAAVMEARGGKGSKTLERFQHLAVVRIAVLMILLRDYGVSSEEREADDERFDESSHLLCIPCASRTGITVYHLERREEPITTIVESRFLSAFVCTSNASQYDTVLMMFFGEIPCQIKPLIFSLLFSVSQSSSAEERRVATRGGISCWICGGAIDSFT